MIELPRRIADHIDQFTGRAWLLPPILKWWDRSDAPLFLLTGDPGTGKSMITAWFAGFGPQPADAGARAGLARIRAAHKAVHFCQANTRNSSPRAFAESVADQLARSVP